eukprot:CAMPEP_0113845720 /NCGR_PEP_ID=MMETSP0372-20130328/915_1 /TAXON_ID=340204 /ORGANISM="Lankesteria abbotti" /LENGTH=395 /DNA_ID=CAMNT_0000814797 /DNA_START=54 /DNA_END=1242 /DNA_ORIENTATION=- /assembly_acc=CAM_ASM_000359
MLDADASPSSQAPPVITVVGVPREIKIHENRVGLTPAAAREFVKLGHTVVVETRAGRGSGFDDLEYVEVGCTVAANAPEVYAAAEIIIKVKEPLPAEYELIREGQVIYAYFHFAAEERLTQAMIDSKCVCIAYETICKDGVLPLLLPMSEVAGKMSVQEGAKYLEKAMGGMGVLLGGVPGVKPGKVVILGGGVVGTNAAKVASGMGAEVVILDVNLQRLRYLDDIMPKKCSVQYNTEKTLLDELPTADLLIGAILIAGRRAPRLVRKEHLKLMKRGAVIVDVAVDQGGCVQTCRPTTHDAPTYVVEGVVHYCVANMPGGVPNTSTIALSNSTLCYGLALANLGWRAACLRHPELKSGLNVVHGDVVHPGVADAFELPLTNVESVFEVDIVFDEDI